MKKEEDIQYDPNWKPKMSTTGIERISRVLFGREEDLLDCDSRRMDQKELNFLEATQEFEEREGFV